VQTLLIDGVCDSVGQKKARSLGLTSEPRGRCSVPITAASGRRARSAPGRGAGLIGERALASAGALSSRRACGSAPQRLPPAVAGCGAAYRSLPPHPAELPGEPLRGSQPAMLGGTLRRGSERAALGTQMTRCPAAAASISRLRSSASVSICYSISLLARLVARSSCSSIFDSPSTITAALPSSSPSPRSLRSPREMPA
jgi:hypothetical protein